MARAHMTHDPFRWTLIILLASFFAGVLTLAVYDACREVKELRHRIRARALRELWKHEAEQ